MITMQGVVQSGMVRLPESMRISDGGRVVITLLEPASKSIASKFSEAIENEDVAFVRTSRGRLAKQLQEAEKE
ncbi:MAG: hypothetical protein AAB354_14895 [candidate division KSB1 bacterium]